ncbi:Putative sporulation-specific glycosylase ydhD [[Flavobacterium] thermophilum]|nr:Putative sporulation-specific glycosylase YdhD [Geobacillus sp. 12AMOR1]STO12426.1 Putative sporulation-specific glycosylase ydhD [[Flavobacterium] thermophilum]
MIEKIKTAFFLFIPHISLSNIAIMFVFKSQVHLLVMNPFFRYTDELGNIHEVWFEDVRSIGQKMNWLVNIGLQALGHGS